MSARIDPLTRYTEGAGGCWLWTGPLDAQSYGRHGAPLAHRVVYELLVGPIPKGLTLDHLCRVRSCVNPDHLEPVTHAENVRRGKAGEVNGDRQRNLTHCKRGHEYTPESTGRDHRGHRFCRECVRQLRKTYYHRDVERSREYARRKQREARTHPPG